MRALTVEELGFVAGGQIGLVSVGDQIADMDGNFLRSFSHNDIFGFGLSSFKDDEPSAWERIQEWYRLLKEMHEEAKRRELERMRVEAQMERQACPVGTTPIIAGTFGGVAQINGNTVLLGPGGRACMPNR